MRRSWTAAEERRLRQMQGRPAREAAALLGRGPNAVNCRRYFLGLTRAGRHGKPPLPVPPLADYPTSRWLAERLAHRQPPPALFEERR
jgi:hypothetical protein